jgi:hypothetical protein
MGDFKHAELALAKEVAQDGLHMSASPLPTFVSAEAWLQWRHDNGSASNWVGHTISGDLNGTQFLDLSHHTDGVRNPYLGDPDTLDFTVTAAHNNFNMTIEGFNPLFWDAKPWDSHMRTIAAPKRSLP